MFISKPHRGLYYLAEKSRRSSHRLLWSTMSVEAECAERVDAAEVPKRIRRAAYRQAYGDRLRAGHRVRLRAVPAPPIQPGQAEEVFKEGCPKRPGERLGQA